MPPRRVVFGIEKEPAVARQAAARLDRVFTIDVEQAAPPLEPASLDCLLFGDVLEHLHDPAAVLRRYRPFLRPQGLLLACIPNIQHHSILTALLKGDFQYTHGGLLDSTHLRFFTYSTILKLLLDGGFAPEFVGDISIPAPPALQEAVQPLLHLLGLDQQRMQRYLSAYQYIVKGTPLLSSAGEVHPGAAGQQNLSISFVACIADDAIAQANLLSSPCLAPGTRHEVLLVRNCRSAAEGLNQGLARARHPLIVCVHQDVYLPLGWPERFLYQYQQALSRFGPLGVAGVYGVARAGEQLLRTGRVVDRDCLLWEKPVLPAPVETLDELLLAVPRGTPLTFDPQLGFHFYGADLCLQARQRGLGSVVLDALCLHNSPHVGLPPAFFVSSQAFIAKWASQLPIATSCAQIDKTGQMRIW